MSVSRWSATLWRHHRRADLRGWVALVLRGAGDPRAVACVCSCLSPVAAASAGASAAPAEAGSVGASTSEALAHPLDYLSYLWQSLLPRLPFMTALPEPISPRFVIFVERGWGAFGWYDVFFPHRVYVVILAAMIAVPILGLIAVPAGVAFVRRNAIEFALLVLMAIAVVAGFEAAFYTPGVRPFIAEFGRYVFPAIGPLAVLVRGEPARVRTAVGAVRRRRGCSWR